MFDRRVPSRMKTLVQRLREDIEIQKLKLQKWIVIKAFHANYAQSRKKNISQSSIANINLLLKNFNQP